MKVLRILGIQKSKYFIEISRVKPGVTTTALWWVASHAKSNFDDLNRIVTMMSMTGMKVYRKVWYIINGWMV